MHTMNVNGRPIVRDVVFPPNSLSFYTADDDFSTFQAATVLVPFSMIIKLTDRH